MPDSPTTITCIFCGLGSLKRIEGKIEPHGRTCSQLAYEHPNATKFTALADPDALLGVVDCWDQRDWVLRREFDDRRRTLLRTYRKNGKPRYLPLSNGHHDPERRLLHRENIANFID